MIYPLRLLALCLPLFAGVVPAFATVEAPLCEPRKGPQVPKQFHGSYTFSREGLREVLYVSERGISLIQSARGFGMESFELVDRTIYANEFHWCYTASTKSRKNGIFETTVIFHVGGNGQEFYRVKFNPKENSVSYQYSSAFSLNIAGVLPLGRLLGAMETRPLIRGQ